MSVRQKFTSKERDNETGLDYFLARYYSSTQGRFTSPDEFTGGPEQLFYFEQAASENPTFYAELEEPQSLNKYHYGLNNPLRYIDPDGHQAVADALKMATVGGAAAGQPEIAAGAAALFVIYVAVDKTVGWQKVGDTFTEVFKGSGAASCPAPVNCGIPQYMNKSNEQNSSNNQGQQQGQQQGDYSNVPDPKNAGPGKKFTPGQKKEILETNKSRNGGELTSDKSGQRLNPGVQTQKGQRRDPNEAQVDHKKARAKGGTNQSGNAQVLSGRENRKKGVKDQQE